MRLPKIPFWQLIAIPLLLWVVGAGMNQAVLIANWGKFPVMYNEFQITIYKAVQQKQCSPSPEEKRLLPPWMGRAAQTPKSPEKFSVFDTSVATNPVCEALMSNGQFTDNVHTIMGHNSNLKFLADVFNLGPAIYSLGDFLILAAEYLGDMAGLAWIVLIIRKFNEAKA
jgi:hypothetical protein